MNLEDGLRRLAASIFHSQNRRLLQLETALPSASLVVERATWRENINGFTLDETRPGKQAPLTPLVAVVDCLSTNAHLELKALVGEQMSLRVMTASGRYRTWHGYVARAAQLGADGGLARYRLQLVAFTHFLSLRRDTRVFLGQRADDLLTQVLGAYPQANFRFELSPEALESAVTRGTTTQYRETDSAFVARLLAEEGWNWRLEHSDDPAPLSSAKQAKHTLVIADAQAERPELGPLRFGRTDVRGGGLLSGLLGGLAEDTITAIGIERRVQPNAVTQAAWDARQLAGVSARSDSALAQGDTPTLEQYDGRGERRFAQFDPSHQSDQAHTPRAEHEAQLGLLRHERRLKTLHGEAAVRSLAAGSNFHLTGHSLYGGGVNVQGALAGRTDNHFCVLAIEHEAANNLGSEAAQLLQSTDIEAGSYRNRFTAVPAAAKLVPDEASKPTAGTQTAWVVGHAGEPLTTERDLRVKIQFPWQRGQQPLPGGLGSPGTPGQQDTGHAPQDATASQWVRVAQPQAGANWGAVFLPRIGTEVLVDFIEGDPDRPLVVGQLHNPKQPLPWPAGQDSDANHPGTISGWHSQPLDRQGHNEWLVDDATGQLRMRLSSWSPGSAWSELSLGHLIQQASSSSQRGSWLGSGFYAHTDGWASVRAAQGILLSSTARSGTYGSAQSTQMDANEAVAQLKAAQDLGQRLSDAAQTQGALKLSSHDKNDTEALQRLLKAIDPKQDGQHEGQKKQQGRTDTDPVEAFAEPHLVLDTPSAAAFASPGPIASYSGQDTSITAQSDVHLAAAHTASWVSGQTTSVYTHEGELQAIAANGNLSLRAHTDAMEILADKDISIVSVNDEIRITASQRIEMVAGDSKVVLDGANIDFVTPGTFTVKAAGHNWGAAAKGQGSLAGLPAGILEGEGPFAGRYALNKTDERPFQGYRYRILDGDRVLQEGKTSETGETELVTTERSRFIKVQKTVMREDQKITENWASYIDGTLSEAVAPERDPIPDDYAAQFEEID
jgi:type VI secretion system secreted protein VgrG